MNVFARIGVGFAVGALAYWLVEQQSKSKKIYPTCAEKIQAAAKSFNHCGQDLLG